MQTVGAALVHLELGEPAPTEAAAGNDIAVTLRASCAAGHDRCRMPVIVSTPDGASAQHAFSTQRGGVSETDDIVLKAPARLGQHVWRFVLPAHVIDGIHYADAALIVPITVVPQPMSLAVWGVPSPVTAGTHFSIRVGAKSAAGCPLSQQRIEICNGTGAVVATGRLGDAPLPGTAALYWAELELPAPEHAGLASWTARFDGADLDVPHEGASAEFSTAVVQKPEHRLTVKVIESETAQPVPDVELRLGAFRGTTGPSGLAEIMMPKGQYELRSWKVGYDIQPCEVDISADADVEIKALVVAEDDPDAMWKM